MFDVLDADDVVIRGNGSLLTWTGSRTYTGGSSSVRYNDNYALGAGVWSNSNATKVYDLRINGFTSGVYWWPYNTTTGVLDAGASRVGNEIHNVEVSNVDWGVLCAGQKSPKVRGLHGSFSIQTGSPNPGHMIYTTGDHATYGDYNEDIDFDGVVARDGADGDIGAFQFKVVKGGRATGLVARNCNGTINFQKCENARFEATHTDDRADQAINTVGSVYFLDDTSRDNIIDVTINKKAGTTGGRVVRVDGTRNTVTIRARERSTTTSIGVEAIAVNGTYNTVDVTLDNLDDNGADMAQGRPCVRVFGDSCRVIIRRARNYHNGVNVAATAEGTHITILGSQYRKSSSLGTLGAVHNDGTGTIVDRPDRDYATRAAAGDYRADTTQYGSADLNVTTTAGFTIWNLGTGAQKIPFGSRFALTIRNNSGGTMGAVTWTYFSLKSPWVAPANGGAVTIDFVYQGGTDFKEIGRTA